MTGRHGRTVGWWAGIVLAGLAAACAPVELPPPASPKALPMVHPRLASVAADAAVIQQPRIHNGKPVVFRLGMRIPQQPAGVVLVIPGHSGFGQWRESGTAAGLAPPNHQAFANRILTPLAVHGVAAAVMTLPSDQQGPLGLSAPAGIGVTLRQSAIHAGDIAAAVDYLRMRFRRPVWVLGWAEATVSVINAAARRPDACDGVILAAPWTEPLGTGLARWRYAKGVLSLPVERIAQPVLIMSHRRDDCTGSAADGPGRLVNRLGRAKAVVSAAYGRAPTPGTGCGPHSAHGFFGLESRMAAAMAGFIQRHSRPTSDGQ